jgi:hypothetical protein
LMMAVTSFMAILLAVRAQPSTAEW